MNLLPVPRHVDLGHGRVPSAGAPTVRMDSSLPAEGYLLAIGDDGAVSIAAADEAGAFYARATLAQLRALEADGALPVGTIRDWPDLPVRGVMLDVSRDKVPTMATLTDLVDRLASWKVNQLQLYIEHTFAYLDHEVVWSGASPFTAAEIRELDAFCRARHVELVPNQNCLGHWDRWLKHEPYRRLAIAPDGWTERGRHREPTTLDPAKPGSLAAVRSLLAELLPNFTSRRVHVGLDEPWELPHERLDDYLQWVRTLRGLPELAGYEMLIWGDILAGKPEALRSIPRGVTVCEWGYDDWHPYEERTAALEAAGLPFWVAPGTSSWLTIIGRVTNMRRTIDTAMESALGHGGTGVLNTDWGDKGHLQYLPVSEPGLAYGAAAGWCHETNRDLDLAAALSVHAFGDATGELGRALVELGDAHLSVTPQIWNMSTLTMHLYWPQLQLGRTFTEGMTIDDLDRAESALAGARARLARARPERADGALVLEELRAASELVSLCMRDACARLAADGTLGAVPERARDELAGTLRPMIDEHRRLWLARNRPGGLDDSAAWLEHLLSCYETGITEKAWGGW